MLDVIKKRRSYRQFKDKDIEESKINEILKAAMFAPSANNLRPWEFIVVRDKETRERLSTSTPWCSFAAQSPLVIAVCAPEQISEQWVEDCSIVASHIYLEVTNQKLGTCMVQIRNFQTLEGRDSEEYVRETLACPENIRVLALFAIGYPDESKAAHTDLEYEERKVHKEHW